MDQEVELIKNQNSSDYFDIVIGHIEDIVIGEEFQLLVNHFMDIYYDEFDYDDENKIQYIEIYQKYTNLMESFIIENLNKKMNFFDMDRFALELE